MKGGVILINIKAREKWKHISECNIYNKVCKFKHIIFVSNYGDVRRYYKNNWIDNNGNNYKLLSQSRANGSGEHLCVGISIKGQKKQKKVRVHRLVALVFVHNTNPEKFNIINHIDGNPTNNYYKNLEWTDTKGNSIHAYKTGLTIVPSVKMYGERNPMCTHSLDNVLKIKDLILEGQTNSEISKITGDNIEYIRKIRKGYRWGKLTGFGNNNIISKKEYNSICIIPRTVKKIILEGNEDPDYIISYIYDKYNVSINYEYIRKIKYSLKKHLSSNKDIKISL